ncbi:MAG: hypothetical protein ACLTST_00490 [Lachnospiraceae bacterium]
MSEAEEAAVCFAQYHILGMTPWHTNESSIAAKGLTGEGYKGHVFWIRRFSCSDALIRIS